MRATVALALVGLTSVAAPDGTRRYVVIPAGHLVDSGTLPCRPAMSSDGIVVAVDASAALDPADQNGRTDVYVLDRAAHVVTLASRSLSGVAGRGTSRCPSLSADGERLVFESDASDLVEGDPPGTTDVFLLDRTSGVLRRLSASIGSGPTTSAHPVISADGRVVTFHARPVDASPSEPTHVYRLVADGDRTAEPVGDGHSPTMSGDGRVMAYVASTPPGVVRVVGPAGTRTVGPPDGQAAGAEVLDPVLSTNGEWIAYVVRTRPAGGPHREGGRTQQVYVQRVDGGAHHLVSGRARDREGNGHSVRPAIDGTGRRVVFESGATNLACGGRDAPRCDGDINLLADVFVWDRHTLEVTRVNTVTPALPWLEGGGYAAISPDGATIAFLSRQPVSEADGRDTFDVFVTPR